MRILVLLISFFIQVSVTYAYTPGMICNYTEKTVTASVKINEDLKHNKAFLKSVQSKLKNKRFIENAPDNVVNNEKKKEADIKIKIKMLELKLKK